MYNYNYYSYQLMRNNKADKKYDAEMNNFCYLHNFYIITIFLTTN